MENTAFKQYVNDMLEDNVKSVKHYLQLEKQQIIDAWNDAEQESKYDAGIACNANDYYSLKYNNGN